VGGRSSVLFGVYLNFLDLRNLADSLKEIGIRTNEISVLFPHGALLKPASSDTDADCSVEDRRVRPEALIGGSLGWLTCITPPPTGELADALIGLGIPPYAAERYEARIRNGGILTAVRSPHPAVTECVCEILAKTGAVGILVTGNAKANTLSRLMSKSASPMHIESRDVLPKQTPTTTWRPGKMIHSES
jgi:hypothetical protein